MHIEPAFFFWWAGVKHPGANITWNNYLFISLLVQQADFENSKKPFWSHVQGAFVNFDATKRHEIPAPN